MIVEGVADRYKLSPFELMKIPFDEVVDIWTHAIISAHENKPIKNKQAGNDAEPERIRVTSETATWH